MIILNTSAYNILQCICQNIKISGHAEHEKSIKIMEIQCTRRLEEIMKHFKLKDPGSAITHFIGMLMAMFAAVRLLPSDGFALVTAKVEQGRSLSAVMQNSKLVRSFT